MDGTFKSKLRQPKLGSPPLEMYPSPSCSAVPSIHKGSEKLALLTKFAVLLMISTCLLPLFVVRIISAVPNPSPSSTLNCFCRAAGGPISNLHIFNLSCEEGDGERQQPSTDTTRKKADFLRACFLYGACFSLCPRRAS